MSFFKNIQQKLRQRVKFSASNPMNFQVLWSFTATRVQILSLSLILVLILGVFSALFAIKGPFSGYFSKNDVSIERIKLEEQNQRILDLTNALNAQQKYLETVKKVLLGKSFEDTLNNTIPEVTSFNPAEFDSEQTLNEKELAEEVKDDLRSGSGKKKSSQIPHFASPVKGVISQKFDFKDHPAIDIVTSKEQTILACQAGTVIFSGYTQKDGYVVLVNHANGYLSVYKHAKSVLKKVGSKVQMNDPIAIVGNTGENSSGPHLHFELWHEQSVINPMDLVDFE